jgi:hypothetical protein
MWSGPTVGLPGATVEANLVLPPSLWRVSFDHLARFVIHDLHSLSRLCRGLCSPLSFDKLARSHQLPALYTNHKGAKIAIAPSIASGLFFSIERLTFARIELFRTTGTLSTMLESAYRTE